MYEVELAVAPNLSLQTDVESFKKIAFFLFAFDANTVTLDALAATFESVAVDDFSGVDVTDPIELVPAGNATSVASTTL